MDIRERIVSRRNIKTFGPEPVNQELLLSWLQDATTAPNHRLTEPWEILFIGPTTRAKLNHKADFGGAPVVLAVLSKREANAADRDENLIATACFVQNFLLLAHAAGIGARWASLGALAHNREILGVSEAYDVVGVFGVGFPSDVPAAKTRTPIAAKIQHLP